MSKSLSERLWPNVRWQMYDGCWEWQGYRIPPYGHGQMSIGRGRLGLAHRVAWELTNGPIPDGMVVRHKCDNPPCVNPNHLELGTQADNVRDAVERGRVARGFALPHTKLSEDQVREIRARHRPGHGGNRRQLAEEFGVTREHIDAIVKRRDRAGVE